MDNGASYWVSCYFFSIFNGGNGNLFYLYSHILSIFAQSII